MTPARFLLLTPGFGTNLLTNSQLAGGGAAPTGYAQPFATGTSAPGALVANGDTSYTQSATAQRPLIATAGSFTLAANTTYALSMDVLSVTGTLTVPDVLRFAVIPAGGTLIFPACPANPGGGNSATIIAGRLRLLLSVAATSGTSQMYFGIGCNGNVTGTLNFASPMLEVGTGKRYRRGL